MIVSIRTESMEETVATKEHEVIKVSIIIEGAADVV